MSTADRDAALAVALVGALILTMAVVGGLTVVLTADNAAAQEEESSLDQITGGDVGAVERIRVANAAIAGMVDRLRYDVSSALGDDGESAATHADNLQSTFNAHNATIENWVNNRTAVSSSEDVFKLEVVQDGETATRYLVVQTDGNNSVTNSTVVDSTDRSVDGTVVLEDYAAAKADDELQTFVDEYAKPGKDVDPALTRRMANQYAGDVTLPFGGDD